MSTDKNINKQTLKIYWQHAWKYKKQQITFYSGLFTAQIAEDFAQPYFVSIILNGLVSNGLSDISTGKLTVLLLAIAGLEMYSHIIMNLLVRILWRTEDLVSRDLNMTVFNHLQRMSMDFYSSRFAGSLVNQVNKFVGSFERLQDSLTWNVYKLIISVVVTTIVLWSQATVLAIAIIVATVIFAPLVWYFKRTQLPLAVALATAESVRTGQQSDTISNIMAVKSFANEKLEKDRMVGVLNNVYDRSIDLMKLNMRQEAVQGLIHRNLNVVVIILSIILAKNGSIQVGTIYLALTFTIQIMRRLWDLNSTFKNVTRVFGDARDMTEILAIRPGVDDIKHPDKFPSAEGTIQLKNVNFAYYDQPDDLVVNNLNFSIKPGERIGLVGHSGSGKTTLSKLLLRFMDIQKGEILIDKVNIAHVSQHDLRSRISYVPQEPLLFHRSLRENITYGKPDATEDEIISVSKKAHAHEFIEKLPGGYDTLVGERGVKLSGGQKQRVAIARAMLKDTPILVLDEATSALDSESEQLIQDALWKLMEGRTAIVIAHRLSTIQKMDRIIVLEDGKIIEDGSPAVLLKKKGQYAKLWKHQSGGFLQD